MSKSVILNLAGFAAFNPILVVDEETGTTTIPHCVSRYLIAEYAIKTAEELGVSTIKCIGGLGAEDIIEDIENKGLKVERVEEI